MEKVHIGQPFSIPASTYNKFIDLARSNIKVPKTKTIFKSNKVQNFYNNTEDDLPIYSVMDVSNFILRNNIETDRNKFESNDLCIAGTSPEIQEPLTGQNFSVRSNAMRVCITQEPLIPNQIGKAIVAGITKCKIKKETGLDTSKKMYVTKINHDSTQMAVTNRQCPDTLIWHDTDFKLGIVHLGFHTLNQTEFIGILDCVSDTAPNTYKLIVRDFYTGKIFHVVNGSLNYFRNLTMIPPRPRSTAVIAQYLYTVGGLDYVEQRPFYDTQQTGIVKYSDDQITLNSTVLGRRSSVDRIAPYVYQQYPVVSEGFWRMPE